MNENSVNSPTSFTNKKEAIAPFSYKPIVICSVLGNISIQPSTVSDEGDEGDEKIRILTEKAIALVRLFIMTDLMAPVAPDAQDTWSEGNVAATRHFIHRYLIGISCCKPAKLVI